MLRQSRVASHPTQVQRFPGRTHAVWLEREGFNDDTVCDSSECITVLQYVITQFRYPNGISNGFPEETQLRIVRLSPPAFFSNP